MDWITETLTREPIRVQDSTTPDSLASELASRLEALLASHNGLEPNAEGWRTLALKLALKYEPAFQLETPVDRDGKSGRPGPRVGFRLFLLRSKMKELMRKGRSQRDAARMVAHSDKKMTTDTAYNLPSRSVTPDVLLRSRYEIIAERAMRLAAQKISQS